MAEDLRPFSYSRFPTREVQVGGVGIGGSNPIRIQSMTTADTNDTEAVVREAIALFQAGAELVRMTAQGPREAHNLEKIRQELNHRGYAGPLVADIHFSPRAAMIAIEHVEKVRINPGNYVDTKRFSVIDYTDARYADELGRLEEAVSPLFRRAGELHRALRIGVNHGSLSDRIMNRFGDTPEGMVESAMEFLRIGKKHGFDDMVVSMKASNPYVMIQAYRGLVARFRDEGMDYPLHLGVTEAGEGRDGRIKSAIGIGALLLDGIGDTIRVSLTEDAVNEMPAARSIIHACTVTPAQTRQDQPATVETPDKSAPTEHDTASPRRVKVAVSWPSLEQKGTVAAVEEMVEADPHDLARRGADFFILPHSSLEQARRLFPQAFPAEPDTHTPLALVEIDRNGADESSFLESIRAAGDCGVILRWENLLARSGESTSSTASSGLPQLSSSLTEALLQRAHTTVVAFAQATPPATITDAARRLAEVPGLIFALRPPNDSALARTIDSQAIDGKIQRDQQPEGMLSPPPAVFAWRALSAALHAVPRRPALMLMFSPRTEEDSLYRIPAEAGSLLLDGIGNILAIVDSASAVEPQVAISKRSQDALSTALDILQATRLRITRTEFISCPGCGRTLFNLQETAARIKQATGHLKGIKIAIMGCIVNGPGEMADADFGYVGAGPGRINLYRNREVVRRNIPADTADRELIALIQEAGLWTENQSDLPEKRANIRG